LAEKKPKKKKKKSMSRRPDAPERSLKRGKTTVVDAGSSKGKTLILHDLEFHKGVNISLTRLKMRS